MRLNTPRSSESRRAPARRRGRWLVFGCAFTAALAMLGAAGPVTHFDASVRPVALPADLDDYLARAERGVPALRDGAQRRIVWRDPARKTRTAYAVIYLHGFSASAPETAPLAERVAAALDANLYLTRLRGHGRDGAAMAEASAGDWLNDAAEAQAIGERLGERVVVIGTSTGGTLATWLAVRPGGTHPHAVVLISPNFGAADPRERLLLLPWAGNLLPLLAPTYEFPAANAAHARHWTTRFPSSVLLQLAALVDHVSRLPLESIAVPTLTFYAKGDQVVDVVRLLAAQQRIGSAGGAPKQLVEVMDSGDPRQHVLAGDILSPATTAAIAVRIVAFVDGTARLRN
jgi:esterase/lipase